jgi:hypothetical protein
LDGGVITRHMQHSGMAERSNKSDKQNGNDASGPSVGHRFTKWLTEFSWS